MRCTCDNGQTADGSICPDCLGGARRLASTIGAVLDAPELVAPERGAQEIADLARQAVGQARRGLVARAVSAFVAAGQPGEARLLVRELWDDLPTELGEQLGLDDLVRRRRVAALRGPPWAPPHAVEAEREVTVLLTVTVM